MRNARLPGSFKLANQQRAFELYSDPWATSADRRIARIIASIQQDLDEGGTCRVRQILSSPKELFRIELERPELAYQRTTILDRDTLTRLLEETPEQTIRESFHFR